MAIRLARPGERMRWDDLVDRHHDLGLQRFADRGLRYIFEWHGQWVGLAGWQSGAFECRPQDRWVGWKAQIQFQRLHWVVNNTRFLLLGKAGAFLGLSTHALSCMTQRPLREERELPVTLAANPQGGASGLRPVGLCSLYAGLSEVPDFRRA